MVILPLTAQNEPLKSPPRLGLITYLFFFLKVTIEKNWRSQNLNFLGLKHLSDIIESLNSKTFCRNLKIRDFGAKLCGFSIILI